MYEIAINDPKVYLDGEAYARNNNSSLSEMVNRYVASLAAKLRSSKKHQKVALDKTEDFQNAMNYVKSLSAKEGGTVPADENGLDALVEKKYKL